jgi:hypothetical protein
MGIMESRRNAKLVCLKMAKLFVHANSKVSSLDGDPSENPLIRFVNLAPFCMQTVADLSPGITSLAGKLSSMTKGDGRLGNSVYGMRKARWS